LYTSCIFMGVLRFFNEFLLLIKKKNGFGYAAITYL